MHTISQDSLCTIYSHVGSGSGSENDIFEGENTAVMKVILSPSCPVPPEEVMAQFVQTTEDTEGLEVTLKQEENSLSSFWEAKEPPSWSR